MENSKSKQIDYYRNLLSLLQSGLDREELLIRIEQLPQTGYSGTYFSILTEVEGLLGKEIGPKYEWKNLKPEVSEEYKKGIIIRELEACIKGEEVPHEKLFGKNIKQISFNGKNIDVEELLCEPWCYILYASKNSDDYYLDLSRNHSSASWSVMHKLSKQQGETFLSNPNYDKARSVAVDAVVEQKP